MTNKKYIAITSKDLKETFVPESILENDKKYYVLTTNDTDDTNIGVCSYDGTSINNFLQAIEEHFSRENGTWKIDENKIREAIELAESRGEWDFSVELNGSEYGNEKINIAITKTWFYE